MEIKHQSTVKDLSLEFSILLIDYEKKISHHQKGNIITQMLRSGTAIGAMICEAQGPESNKDFIHKMKIAYKESEETEYWIKLQHHSFPSEELKLMLSTLYRIKQMLGKILSTCAQKANLPK